MLHAGSRRRVIGVLVLAGLALGGGAAFAAPEGNAPIALRIGAGSDRYRDDNEKAVLEGLRRGLEHARWARLVPEGEEVLVEIYGLMHIQSGRTTDKKGKVTLQIHYTASARVEIGGHWTDTLEDEKFHSEGEKSYYPSVTDPSNFRDIGESLSAKLANLVVGKLDELRPERPQPGFAFKPKFKFLFKGDGLEVPAVDAGGPAARAGLRVNDRIRQIDSEENTNRMAARADTWWVEPAGTRVTLVVERKKERQTVELALQPRSRWGEAAQPASAAGK